MADGALPYADFSRLLVRRVAKRADGSAGAEEWRAIATVPQLQALLDSLRPNGEREHYLLKAVNEVRPQLLAAMGGGEEGGGPAAEASEAAGAAEARGAEEATGGAEGAEGAEAGAEAAAEQDGVEEEQEDEEDEEDEEAAAAADGEEEGEEEDEEDEEADLRPGPGSSWLPARWKLVATRFLEISLSEDKCEAHRQQASAAVRRDGAASGSAMLMLKLEMLDVFAALPVAPPLSEHTARPASDASRRHWVNAVKAASTPDALSSLLLQYVRQVPRTSFRKGFHKWWLVDGGVEEEVKKPAAGNRAEKEMRRLAPTREDSAKGGKAGKASKADEKAADDEPKEPKEHPPAQAVSAHQVALRLHLTDAGLAYGGDERGR